MIRNGIEYRPWPRDERYLAGSDGSIIGPAGWKLKPGRGKDGRLHIRVSKNSVRRTVRVHTIIAEAFHGLRPVEKECAHGNGVNNDNRPENLRWATRLENAHDMRAHGTVLFGERHSMAKLTEAEVRTIRAEYSTEDTTYSGLAKRHGISLASVGLIVQGRNWAHVPVGPVVPPKLARGERVGNSRLTESKVRKIRSEYAAGDVSQEALAKQYGVTQPTIGYIVRRKTWKHVTDDTQPRVVSVTSIAPKNSPKTLHTGGVPMSLFRSKQSIAS